MYGLGCAGRRGSLPKGEEPRSGHLSGAVIYDVSVVEEPDGFRSKGIYPDKALGQEAVRAMQPGRFPSGTGCGQRA